MIACYREQSVLTENPTTGRQMTVDTTQCYDDERSSLWPDEQFTDQFMQAKWGNPHMAGGPEGYYNTNDYGISQYANLPPIPVSPVSPFA